MVTQELAHQLSKQASNIFPGLPIKLLEQNLLKIYILINTLVTQITVIQRETLTLTL